MRLLERYVAQDQHDRHHSDDPDQQEEAAPAHLLPEPGGKRDAHDIGDTEPEHDHGDRAGAVGGVGERRRNHGGDAEVRAVGQA